MNTPLFQPEMLLSVLLSPLSWVSFICVFLSVYRMCVGPPYFCLGSQMMAKATELSCGWPVLQKSRWNREAELGGKTLEYFLEFRYARVKEVTLFYTTWLPVFPLNNTLHFPDASFNREGEVCLFVCCFHKVIHAYIFSFQAGFPLFFPCICCFSGKSHSIIGRFFFVSFSWLWLVQAAASQRSLNIQH